MYVLLPNQQLNPDPFEYRRKNKEHRERQRRYQRLGQYSVTGGEYRVGMYRTLLNLYGTEDLYKQGRYWSIQRTFLPC